MAAFLGMSPGELIELSETAGLLPHDNNYRPKLEIFFSKLLRQDGRNNRGFIAHLSHNWIKEGIFNYEDALNLLLLLWEAGSHTTAIGLSRVMEFLLKHPEQWPHLIENPRNQIKFIEEVLRLKPPTICLSRSVVKDIKLGKQQLKAGEQIWLNI